MVWKVSSPIRRDFSNDNVALEQVFQALIPIDPLANLEAMSVYFCKIPVHIYLRIKCNFFHMILRACPTPSPTPDNTYGQHLLKSDCLDSCFHPTHLLLCPRTPKHGDSWGFSRLQQTVNSASPSVRALKTFPLSQSLISQLLQLADTLGEFCCHTLLPP